MFICCRFNDIDFSVTIDNHSLFLFLLRLTISSKTLPDLRWSKRGSTGSMVYIGFSQTALNRSSFRSTLKSAFLVSSTSNSSCYLFFFFYSSFYLLLSFIVFFCFLREGTYSSSVFFGFLFFVSKPPSKVIWISSSAFLYFLLQVFLQSLRSTSFLVQLMIFLTPSSFSTSSSLMYMLQSTLSSSFSVSLLQFFFFSEAARESSGSYQLRLTLLWPRALVMKFLTQPPAGNQLHSSLSWLASNWISSGTNLRSKGKFEFQNWFPSHSLYISSAVRLESHSMTAQKYLSLCFSYSLSFFQSKAFTSSYLSSKSCFNDFLHYFPLVDQLSFYSACSFHMPLGPYFSYSYNFSFPMLDMQTFTLLIQPALVLNELKRSIRSFEEMFIQSQLHKASLLVAWTSSPFITCQDSSFQTLSTSYWPSQYQRSLSSEDYQSQFSIHSFNPSCCSGLDSSSSFICSWLSSTYSSGFYSYIQQYCLSSLLVSLGLTLRPYLSIDEVFLKEGSLIILLNRLSILTLVTLELGVMNLGSQDALANRSSFFWFFLSVLLLKG